ncbi:signal transduction histidine kinase/CheY-like chemotaxis protein [Pedobacter cryoconitis]|uniref:ATP-binding protein n=1 Tax=Pedobacter cryoconitis TaxID=188932 RepID=UPI00161A32B1|nr:ATP-binding protein [Pedobacter cryoconitis]MBB6271565.1 signal transduction histidine kinase/CheY-like chemotaxis protein [Pedobacter cryoconitis]
MNIIIRLREKYSALLRDKQIPLMQSRVRILTFGLILMLVLLLIIATKSLFKSDFKTASRLSISIGAMAAGLYFLLEKKNWQLAGHLFLLALCSIIWTNLLLYTFGINLVSLQLSLIIISASFYTLGKNWGIVYSLANVIPIIIHLLFTNSQDGRITVTPLQLNNSSFMLALVANFGILIAMHHEFFKSFFKSHSKERELNIQLQSALKEAQQATRLRSDFLSSMSHELRTPLHAVIGLINILSVENPRKDQEENLAILRFSAENLLALINDTLDFSKMNAEQIELNKSPFNLSILLQNILASFRPKAELKNIDIRLNLDFENTPLHIIGDQTRLAQILNNLISNALKFTDNNGKVEISVETKTRSDDHILLLFAIKDSGIGIPKNKQEIIFEPFLQANNNITKRYGGTGLGLAIVKRLISLHQSKLILVSEENTGSIFSFEINYELAAPIVSKEPEPVTSTTISNISNLNILIAEDNIINIMLLKKILDQWNCNYSLSKNGKEALDMVKTGVYDVVLMDIHMPVMDGFEASRQIRELPDVNISKIKIIALTASSDVDIQQSFSYTYLDDYLTKPFSSQRLKEKLEAVVQQLSGK